MVRRVWKARALTSKLPDQSNSREGAKQQDDTDGVGTWHQNTSRMSKGGTRTATQIAAGPWSAFAMGALI